MSDDYGAIAYLFDRIPALAALRGVPRIEAEEAIRGAVDQAVEFYRQDSEVLIVNMVDPLRAP